MKDFNSNKFIKDLEEQIIYHINNDMLENDYDSIQEYIYQVIDSEVIYYADAWAIADDLGNNDFENPITGETCKNITELAFYSLLDYVQNELNIEDIIESLEEEGV